MHLVLFIFAIDNGIHLFWKKISILPILHAHNFRKLNLKRAALCHLYNCLDSGSYLRIDTSQWPYLGKVTRPPCFPLGWTLLSTDIVSLQLIWSEYLMKSDLYTCWWTLVILFLMQIQWCGHLLIFFSLFICAFIFPNCILLLSI